MCLDTVEDDDDNINKNYTYGQTGIIPVCLFFCSI